MATGGEKLAPEAIGRALDRLAAWRSEPEAALQCPVCEAAGLVIADRSTRPYAEWYALSCASCGLDHTIHIPLGPPVPGASD